MKNPTIFIFGGGTFNYTACHFATAAPAFGKTARKMDLIAKNVGFETNLILTKMANRFSDIVTNEDLTAAIEQEFKGRRVDAVIFNAAVADFELYIDGQTRIGKNAPRLSTDEGSKNGYIAAAPKIAPLIKMLKPNTILATFKTTHGATQQEMVNKGLAQMKKSKSDFVFVNDVETRANTLITPISEKHYGQERTQALRDMVSAIYEEAISSKR